MAENVAIPVGEEKKPQDAYRRVTSTPIAEPIQENEIRLTGQGRMKNYIEYATSLLEEKKMDSITIKAMGKAINKAVACAEIVKRRAQGDLHQHTNIGSVEVKDVFEPLQEGLTKQEFTRHISMISIQLSRQAGDTAAPGYQAPIPLSEHRPDYFNRRNFNGDDRGRGNGHRGRGFSRGGRTRGGYLAPRPEPIPVNSALPQQAVSTQPVTIPIAVPASLEPLPPRRGSPRGRASHRVRGDNFDASGASTSNDSNRGGRGGRGFNQNRGRGRGFNPNRGRGQAQASVSAVEQPSAQPQVAPASQPQPTPSGTQ